MNTPIVDFVKEYANRETLRLHMPGHKGKNFLGFEKQDISEIEGADVLYKAEGIIKESEDNAAVLFGTGKTLYSAEGSSLAIRALLYLTKLYGNSIGKRPLIFAGRNAHKAFVTAAALLGFDVMWLLPENSKSIISCNITADYLDSVLKNTAEKPIAVYVTSPDYLGNVLDIASLTAVCRKHGVLLLADNAHGAYLKFLPKDSHPIHLGADICCDSAHKTLPVLTGGAYLHISKNAPEIFAQQAETALSLFATTSPSYLILQSLDMANRYLTEGYRERLALFIKEMDALKNELKSHGYAILGNEPLKLTIAPKSYGYTGNELAEILSEKGIFCEFSDRDFTVFMFTPEVKACGLQRLKNALLNIEKKKEITSLPPIPSYGKKRLSLQEAVFAPAKELSIELCRGRISANATVTCPPAIPIVVCGEEIDSRAIECFKYYGITTCLVVDE